MKDNESPLIRMAGSDGNIYKATADRAHELADAAREEGVALKPLIMTKDPNGETHEINPFDQNALREAADRGDTRVAALSDVKENYFSYDALKAGFIKGVFNDFEFNPVDRITDMAKGIGTAATTVARGFVKGSVGTALRAFQGATYLGETATNAMRAVIESAREGKSFSDAFNDTADHSFSQGVKKFADGFDKIVDKLTPDFFEMSGDYDGIEGAKDVTGGVRSVAEMVANLKGIGALTKGMQASSLAAKAAEAGETTAKFAASAENVAAAAKTAHRMTGAIFALGKYGEMASDPMGPGGLKQQVASVAAATVEGVIFGVHNPIKISEWYNAKYMAPFETSLRKEVTRRVLQSLDSGLTMSVVEAAKQTAEMTAGIGQKPTEEQQIAGLERWGKTWGERTIEEASRQVLTQFAVGSGFVAAEILEEAPSRVSFLNARGMRRPNVDELPISEQLKVALTYRTEQMRKQYAPAYHSEAVYAYNRFVKMGQAAESFKNGLSFGPHVRRVNEDGSVTFLDGSVWRAEIGADGKLSATITISDGTILSPKGELVGYRATRENGEKRPDKPSVDPEKPQTLDEVAQTVQSADPSIKPESNAPLLLDQIADGKLPTVQLDTAQIELLAPTDNGSFIEVWQPEIAKPIIVLQDYEGNYHALTGGKRLASAIAAGSEKINAVVVKESDGWTKEMASGLSATENLREGRGTFKNIIDAVDLIGEDAVSAIAGRHQSRGDANFASTMRRALDVSRKGTTALKDAVAAGKVSDDTAYAIAMSFSQQRLGENWLELQNAVTDMIGRVGTEELHAVVYGLRERALAGELTTENVAMEIAKARTKYNRAKGGTGETPDSDGVLIETGDNELKTLGEVEAGSPAPEAPQTEAERYESERLFKAATEADANKCVELRPADDGSFTTLAFPEVRISLNGETKTVEVRGLTVESFEQNKLEDMSALVAKIEAFARKNGAKIGLTDEVREIWDTLRGQIVQEGMQAYSAERMQQRAQLLDRLAQSQLGSGVVIDKAQWDATLGKSGIKRWTNSKYENYGFVDPETGKIYLNPYIVDFNTPIHEYGHLAMEVVRNLNPELMKRGLALASMDPLMKMITSDPIYARQGKDIQAEEVMAYIIAQRGELRLKEKGLGEKIKAWFKEFWTTFGKAMGIKDLDPETIEKMSLNEICDAIEGEMVSGRKFGEGFAGIAFADGAASVQTKPVRVMKKAPPRVQRVNKFIRAMTGGSDDFQNTDTDLLTVWAERGGRLFDKLPFEVEGAYSKRSKSGMKLVRSTVSDEFAESTAWYKDLTPGERKLFFGVDQKMDHGAIGEGLKNELEALGITRFTNPDGSVDFEGLIADFRRQWSMYERGSKAILEERESSERAAWEEEQRIEREANNEISAEEAAARAEMEQYDAEVEAQIADDIANGRFSRGGVRFSRSSVKPWPEGFPKVGVHTTLGVIKGKYGELHKKAKAGDREAAADLIERIVKPERIMALAARHPDAIVVPVHAEEATGRNQLPKVYAECIGRIGGLQVDDGIVQSVKANHTGANAVGRLTRRAEFDGNVEKGREYILVDDHITQGGTLNELRHYIENNGGKVVEVTTLTASQNSTILSINKATVDALVRKFGNAAAKAISSDASGDRGIAPGREGNGGVLPSSLGEASEGVGALRKSVEKLLSDANVVGNLDALTENEARYLLKFSPEKFVSTLLDAREPQTGAEAQEGRKLRFSRGRPYQKAKQPENGTSVRYTGNTPEATALTRRSVAAVRSSVASFGSLANAAPKVKGAIEGIDKALESIETGKPVKGFSKAVSPKNLITTLKIAGFKRSAEGAPSAYLVLEDRSIRISNHSSDAYRFKKDNNLSVKLVLGDTHKPFNKDAGKNVIEATYGGKFLKENPERFAGMLRDIAEFAATGEFHDTTGALDIKFSGSDDYVTKAVNSLADDARARGDNNALQKLQQQLPSFKKFFAGSKVVDANGEPLVVYRGAKFDPLAQEPGKGVIMSEAYFTGNPEYAKRYTGNDGKVRAYYLNIRRPFDIRDPECLKDLQKIYPDHEFQRGKSGALDWAEASIVDGELLRDNFGDKYDGIIYDEGGDPTDGGPTHRGISYVPLDGGSQVKSATDNIGTFDLGNNDIRYSRPPAAEFVGITRVADDAGQGERTPGMIAASTELSRTKATPLTTRGTRYVSLPLSELHSLWRQLTKEAVPADMLSGKQLGAAGATTRRRVQIAADVIGVVDKTDMAVEKTFLKQHGFFKNEDPQWCMSQTPLDVRNEAKRSEEALGRRLDQLADRRTRGVEPGGQSAGRKVFADQLAKIVMKLPHGQKGILGNMQTVAGALQKRVQGNDAEADGFLDWMNGTQPGAVQRTAMERKAEMFGAFLVMPREMEARAKGWYNAIRSTIAGDKALADAFRQMTVRSMTEQAYGHLAVEIKRAQDATSDAAIQQLRNEASEPIKAGGIAAEAKEKVVLAAHDRMGASMVRIDENVRNYLAAQKKLMDSARTPADKAAIKQATDLFMGEVAHAKNQCELARTAWERGLNNCDARYLYRMVEIINEATVRDGLRMADISLYLDQKRVIETGGLSGSRGQNTRQAQLILDAMKKRLGSDWAKLEAFANKFHAIHEQEFINDPSTERILGKGMVDYFATQTHYVTTKRQYSAEELADIEAARTALRASGANNGDDIIGAMFKYCIKDKPTAKLKGSFSDKQEVMSATFEKVANIKQFIRRSEYVIELRDLLMKTKVEGVHDFAQGKNDFKQNARYGTISYMEGGQMRTLVVPRQIADGFARAGDYNNGFLKLASKVNGLARQLWIDWNPVYWNRNIARNVGSMEMNVPGMREAIIKRGLRFVFPGVATTTELALHHLVRHMPEKMSLPIRMLWGEHTALFYAPKAKRMAMWLTDHNAMQKKLWDAQARGDAQAVKEMMQDRQDMLDALGANMLVGGSAGKMSGTGSFLDESVRTVGKTMLREIQEENAKGTLRKVLDKINIFEKNSNQQNFEDVMAKFTAYLHDRANFGKNGNNRSIEETGLLVKQNVSIGEGERRGSNAGVTQAIFQPFWNMVEKGIVRNLKAYKDRPGEMLQKAAWRIVPMITSGLAGSGALAAWILKANGGDEEKAKSGPMGEVYNYLRDYQRAYQNCSNYVRENYNFTPLWTRGYTSVVLGTPLVDEERVLKPIARFVTDAASAATGVKTDLEVAKAFRDSTFGLVTPDFKLAAPLWTILDDVIHVTWENPDDYYTGGTKYDNDLWLMRNESWEMRGKFAAAMGKRLWNDFGGRNILPVDRGGVDNGLGTAPGWVAKAVNDIPVASPILRSFIKIQVGSPRRDAAEITAAEKKANAAIRLRAKELFEDALRKGADISMDPSYAERLAKWRKTDGFDDIALAKIEAKYLNAWREYDRAQYNAEGEREKFKAKARKIGLENAGFWLDFD